MYRKRHRTTYNAFQLRILEEAFKQNSYPTTTVREVLADKTFLEPSRVQVWFQNRRAKHKKQLNRALRWATTTSVEVVTDELPICVAPDANINDNNNNDRGIIMSRHHNHYDQHYDQQQNNDYNGNNYNGQQTNQQQHPSTSSNWNNMKSAYNWNVIQSNNNPDLLHQQQSLIIENINSNQSQPQGCGFYGEGFIP